MNYSVKNTHDFSKIITIHPVFSGKSTQEQFAGEKGETLFVIAQGEQRILVGLGEQKTATTQAVVGAIAGAVRMAQEKKHTHIGVMLSPEIFKLGESRVLGEQLARAIGLATYQFKEYITDTKRHVATVEEIIFFGVGGLVAKSFRAGLTTGQLIDDAVRVARDLGNHTPGTMHPQQLGQEAIARAKGIAKLTVQIMGKKEITAEGMGGLLGVAAGSVREPAFIVMKYMGAAAKKAPVVFVGKGITFDAGGISIKPADKMDEMKFDMMGGATVIAATLAIARMKLPVNVIALVPAAENLPSGSAIVPGEILKMHSGKTVEVLNTDAEGRLILADALSYARRFNPAMTVDIATLTGACVIALGDQRAGMWSTDDRVAARIEKSAATTGEMVWRMPLGEDISAAVRSEVADLKNITGREGSSNTAAAFLQEFAPGSAWAHLDIAGVANSSKPTATRRVGATGWGVALLVDLVRR